MYLLSNLHRMIRPKSPAKDGDQSDQIKALQLIDEEDQTEQRIKDMIECLNEERAKERYNAHIEDSFNQ